MKTLKGLWIVLAVVLFSSATFGSVSLPAAVAPQQAVVQTVLQALDGVPPAPTARILVASNRVSPGKSVAPRASETAAAADEAENARIAQYVALHKAHHAPTGIER